MATSPPISAPANPAASPSYRQIHNSTTRTPSPSDFLHGTFKGEPAITIPKDIEASLAAKFDKSLIGKFSQGKPSMEIIRKFLSLQNFKGLVLDGLIDKKHVLLRFELAEDYVRFFSKPIWNVYGKSMRILKWTPDFDVDRESSIVPIWISLPRLPIHLINEGFIFSLVSSFSKPLRIDGATEQLKRPSVARVQVEFDLLESLPSRIWVQKEAGNGFWQSIEIEEALPMYCNFCWHIGHQQHSCNVKYPEFKQYYTQKQRHWEFKPKQQVEEINMDTTQQKKDDSIVIIEHTTEVNELVDVIIQERDAVITTIEGIEEKSTTSINQNIASNGEPQARAENEGPMQAVITQVLNKDEEIIYGSTATIISPLKIMNKGKQAEGQNFEGNEQCKETLVPKNVESPTIECRVVDDNQGEIQQKTFAAADTQLLESTVEQMKDKNHQILGSVTSAGCFSAMQQAAPIFTEHQMVSIVDGRKMESMGKENDPKVVAPMEIKGPSDIVLNDSSSCLAEGKMEEVIAYSEGCPISNPFEVLSMPSTKEKSLGIDKFSIQSELRYMSLDPKAQLGEYISDKVFEEKFTPAKKITRTRKPKQIFDI